MRPRPIIKQSEDRNLLGIVTPWGSVEGAESAATEIFRYIEAAMGDVEVTSPFEMLSCLTSGSNYLRTAISIANESHYRGVNKSQYEEGIEVLLLLHENEVLSWASLGSPQMLLQKRDFPLQPLVANFDLNFELGLPELGPLPSQLLGINSQCNIISGSIKIQDSEDRLILYSGSYISSEAYFQFSSKGGLEGLTKTLSTVYSEMPFWLAQIEF